MIDRLDNTLIAGTQSIEEQTKKDTPIEYELRRQEKSIAILRENIIFLRQKIGPILGPLGDDCADPMAEPSGQSQLARAIALNNESIENLNLVVLEALKGLEI